MTRLSLTFGVLAAVVLIVVAELVRRRRLKERHAAIWLLLGAGVAIALILPALVGWLSEFLGFGLPANLVFVAGLVILTFVGLQLSVDLGRLRDLVERLASEVALLSAEREVEITGQAPDSDPADRWVGDDDEEG